MSQKIVKFRASMSGALMVMKQGAGITENQLEKIKELEYERDNLVNYAGNKVKFEGTTKPALLEELIAKRDSPPELSDTAKVFIRQVWLKNKKGVVLDVKSNIFISVFKTLSIFILSPEKVVSTGFIPKFLNWFIWH